MALNIKDQDTHALVRRLATATGESLTEAVRTAVAERLTRVERAAARADDDLVARLNAIARHCGFISSSPNGFARRPLMCRASL